MGNNCLGRGHRHEADGVGYGHAGNAAVDNNNRGRSSSRHSIQALQTHTRLASVGYDIRELITETLQVIRTLVNNAVAHLYQSLDTSTSADCRCQRFQPSRTSDRETDYIFELSVLRNPYTINCSEQEPPSAMLKLNIIAEKDTGWILITDTMINVVPLDNPLGPAVITLFLDESPLPTKDTVSALLARLCLDDAASRSVVWNRNACIVLGCIAEKLAGWIEFLFSIVWCANSAATFKDDTMDYLIGNLQPQNDPNVILFSLIALEKYAQTNVNQNIICRRLNALQPHPLELLETHVLATDWSPDDGGGDRQLADTLLWHQVGFCAQSALDNIFVNRTRTYTYERVDTSAINAMLNHRDVSEYLKISPNGLEARCDVLLFESVRCTYELEFGVSFYEVLIITPGVMQIGWATKDSKFFNHEGFGIGDDEFSVAYDGCRQYIWHSASSYAHSHQAWQPGDYLGCLMDLNTQEAQFFLNGVPLDQPHKAVFQHAASGFFAAASFMSFQQCRFNFGAQPFKYPPKDRSFRVMNELSELTDEQRTILPRRRKLELMKSIESVDEDSCQLCYARQASTTLMPCRHGGMCGTCAAQLDLCPMCRAPITSRIESTQLATAASTSGTAAAGNEVVDDGDNDDQHSQLPGSIRANESPADA